MADVFGHMSHVHESGAHYRPKLLWPIMWPIYAQSWAYMHLWAVGSFYEPYAQIEHIRPYGPEWAIIGRICDYRPLWTDWSINGANVAN